MNADSLSDIRTCMQTALELTEEQANAIDTTTTMTNVSNWDSARHMRLILELERFFSIEFTDEQIFNMGSIAAIQEALAEQVAQ